MNAIRNWRAYLPARERLYLLLAVSVVAALALGIFLFVALVLVPNVRTRTNLIGVVATAEQNANGAETAAAAAPSRVSGQVATAQANVKDAAGAFLSEAQAAAALNQLYQYARASGVTIADLQAQAAPQAAEADRFRLITFSLRVTGELPRLVNFLARMREATLRGFAINNVTITQEEMGAVATMTVAIYTSPYAADATQPITGVLTPPVLPPLPTPITPLPGANSTPSTTLPTPGLPPTVTLLPTLAPSNTPLVPAPTAVVPTPVPPTPVLPTAPGATPIVPTPLPTAPGGCALLLTNGDFETDGAWLIGQSAKPPQFTSSQRHGGARAMQLGSPPESGVLNRGSYSSIRQLVTIPANAPVVTLRWWHLYGSAEATTGDPGGSSDRQEVLLLRADEKVLAVLQRVRRNDGGWQQESVDLTAYRGQSFYLYFNVFNDGNGAATWAYVDDIQLDTCGATPVPTSAAPTPTTGTPVPTNTPVVTTASTPTPTTPVTVVATPTLTLAPTGEAPTPTTPAGCSNVIANGDFENNGGWLIGQTAFAPQYTTSPLHSGARAIQLGNPPAAGLVDRGSYSSIRQLLAIPASASTVTLRWWHYYGDAEAVANDPGPASDRQEVLLLTPSDQVLAVLQRVRRNEGGWQQETVDLTAYRGQSLYLYFNVYNNGNGAATWAYIDDVQVESCSGVTPAPTVTATLLTPTNTPVGPTVTLTPTVSPTAPVTCSNGVVNGGFESDGGWVIGSSGPSAKLPQITLDQKYSGARAMQLGNTPGIGGTPTSEENPQGYSSVQQLVTLPATASSVTLRWWHFYGTEESVTNTLDTMSDRQEVLLWQADKMPLAIVLRVRRNDGAWQQEAVDLTAYRGQSIYLYFNVFNDGIGGNTWMYLDEVQLEICTP